MVLLVFKQEHNHPAMRKPAQRQSRLKWTLLLGLALLAPAVISLIAAPIIGPVCISLNRTL